MFHHLFSSGTGLLHLHCEVVCKQNARLTKAHTCRFGYGKQACPGRFLAIRQVKLVLAKLFHGYDIRWAGKPPKKISRQVVEGQIFPDISTQVCLRKRKAT